MLSSLIRPAAKADRTYDPEVDLVEREEALATLAASISDAAVGEGRLVLVSGEAGAGKTSLIRAAAAWGEARVLWGNCDGLLTPRPLGPLLDAVETVDGVPEHLLAAASRHEVFGAALGQLSGRAEATLLVIEDAHWADGASIDLLRYLARRVERTRGVLAVTYRDDDLDQAHPLRAFLGDVGYGPAVRRIRLRPLSRRAVIGLAAAAGADGAEVFRLSGGNPYVVSELLADPAGAAQSIGDVVRSRAARLPPAGREVLEAASVMSEGAEPAVLIRLAGGLGGLDAAVTAGLLVEDGVLIRFRHELARQATEAGLTPERRAQLHAAVLAALLVSGLGEPTRCAHHADAAGDRDQVLRFARLAADRAIALGSHREAVAQLERALRYAGDRASTERAELLDQLSEQYLLLDRTVEALRAHDEALALWRTADDPIRLGDCLRRRAEILRYSDNAAGATQAAQAAIDLLNPLGDSATLARAYAGLAQTLMLAEQFDQATAAATQAADLAERLGHEPTRAHALTTLGTARALAGDEGGLAQIEEGAARSRAAGLDADSVRATSNLISSRLLYDRVDGLQAVIEEEIDFAAERGMEVHTQCIRVALAQLRMNQGGWDEAGEIARLVVTYGTSLAQRIEPLILLGTLRARRGDPNPEALLEEALQLAFRLSEPQLIYPAYRALAETAWLAGQSERAARLIRAARETLAHAPLHPLQPEVAYWCWRIGVPGPELHNREHPFALQVAGCPQEAARRWRHLGFRYQEADALADSPAEADQRRAWALFDSLGAAARAAEIARRLRAGGARDLPRRPQPASRANPAGLTERQLEIAGLIAAHLTNQEIAERLYLSPRTVDHHVSAILGKLEVTNRRHAAQRCQDLGIAAG